jgi:hypothetical protein
VGRCPEQSGSNGSPTHSPLTRSGVARRFKPERQAPLCSDTPLSAKFKNWSQNQH